MEEKIGEGKKTWSHTTWNTESPKIGNVTTWV